MFSMEAYLRSGLPTKEGTLRQEVDVSQGPR